MTENGTIRLGFCVLLILGHGVAWLQYHFHHLTVPVPAFWSPQVAVLLSLSALLSLGFAVVRNKGALFLFLALQFTVLLLVGYPEGDYLGLETTLLCLLVFEAGFFFPLPLGLGLGAAMIATTLLAAHNVSVWNQNLAAATGESKVSLSFFAFFSFTAAFFLRRLLGSIRRQKDMIDRLDGAVAQLTGANLEFQEYATIASLESVVNERKRIARDIHDTIGYHLMNMIMMMEAAIDLAPREAEKLKEILEQTRNQAREGLTETRRALRALRTMEEENLGGLKSVQKLTDVFEKVTGVEIQREYGNLPFRLPEEVSLFMYRMVQEGLTNAFKHGRATKIVLHFWIDDEKILHISIRDNGRGTAGDMKEGIGIAGMKERVEKISGVLEARNVFDGFELAAAIPLGNAEEAEKKEAAHE